MTLEKPAILLSVLVLGCGTLATEAGDSDAERPNALAGPFRLLAADEIDGLDAPYVLKKKFSDFREPTALADDPAEVLGATTMYALRTEAGSSAIYRFLAPDGRSFSETPAPATPVLVADAAWEGASLDAPEAARVGDELWLYYSAEGGIGTARSSDGVSFTKLGAVLTPGGAAWEGGLAPRAPGFVEVATGDYRLFYEVNGRIGEARSSDGLVWERLGDAPVLEPAADSAADPPFDGAGVGDPEPLTATSAEGRRLTRVYYTGKGGDGASGIGLAARFGTEGPLTRASAPAFASTRLPHAPAVLPQGSVTLLFVTQGASLNDEWPAIAAGIAPATRRIPLD